MGFNAATAVEALDFDFTTLDPCPEELRDAKGVIPEPDIETLNAFSEGFYGLLRLGRKLIQIERPVAPDEDVDVTVDGEGVAIDPETVHELIQDWHESLTTHEYDAGRKELESTLIDLMMLVCRPVLTEAQLRAIPGRVRTAFVSWLVGELITPKGSQSVSVPLLGVSEG